MDLENSTKICAMKHMLNCGFLHLFLLLVTACTVWAQGHRLRTDRVEVQTRTHWQAWDFPTDMVEISPTGTIKSKYIQSPHNAVLDAENFTYGINAAHRALYDNSFDADGEILARGGIKKALSNGHLASRMIDGDEESFWEPDPLDPLETWVVAADGSDACGRGGGNAEASFEIVSR